MPALDRRIIVRRSVSARNLFGESVETTTDYPQWATRQDFERKPTKRTAGGTYSRSPRRAYVIRYRAELADAATSELTVLDGGLTLDCDQHHRGDGARRAAQVSEA